MTIRTDTYRETKLKRFRVQTQNFLVTPLPATIQLSVVDYLDGLFFSAELGHHYLQEVEEPVQDEYF